MAAEEWEPVASDGTERLTVPGGWLYRSGPANGEDLSGTEGMCYVPDPDHVTFNEALRHALILEGVARAHARVRAVTMPIDAEASTDPLLAMDQLLAEMTAEASQ